MTLTTLEMSLLGVVLGVGGTVVGKMLFANGKVAATYCKVMREQCEDRLRKIEITQQRILNWARYELQNKGMNQVQITEVIEQGGELWRHR